LTLIFATSELKWVVLFELDKSHVMTTKLVFLTIFLHI